MNRDDYLRAVDLFEELRELSEEERAEKLSGVASAVRHQVLTLLEADRELESGPFLNEGAMVDAARLLAWVAVFRRARWE